MAQINPYYPGVEFRNFPELPAAMANYYDLLYDSVMPHTIMPRWVYENGMKIGFKDMFYYINMLYDNNPQSVVDVGCGECTWKRWFPNIIGFDPNVSEFSQADFVDFFDKDFSLGHPQHYDAGMAICSIHFIEWDFVTEQCKLAMNIVKDRFLFSFNFHQLRNKPAVSHAEQVELFYDMVKATGFEILLFDNPVARDESLDKIEHWFYNNGTVRFILGHK